MSSEIERLAVHYKQPLYKFLRWCYRKASHNSSNTLSMSATFNPSQFIDPNWTVYAAPISTLLQVSEQLGLDTDTLVVASGLDASELTILGEQLLPIISASSRFLQ